MYDDNLEERYELAIGRIRDVVGECDREVSPEFVSYFRSVARFIARMDELKADVAAGELGNRSLEELQALNRKLYSDVAGDNYDTSFANPEYAVRQMGELYGRILSFLYMEVRGMIVYAYEGRLFDMTVTAELFLEVYCLFEADARPKYKEIHDAIYWYVSDYSDITVRDRVAEQLDVNRDFAVRIVMESNLGDLRYLYDYGEYITDNEIRTAKYLNSLGEDEIDRMASTFTEGYRKGFELAHKDLSKKSIVNIRYCVGFERLVRASIRQFATMGLKPSIYRAAVNSINKGRGAKVGYYSTSPNRQMDFDHRNDSALYMDSDFVTRKLGALRAAYEQYSVQAGQFAGPAVMEAFGEAPFQPVAKKECYRFEEYQQKLNVKYSNEAGRIVNEYIKGEERSFTIIAYPLPEIASSDEEYRRIFDDVIKINTLDYGMYEKIQQSIIDVLDGAEHVLVKGRGDNCTDMRVSLMSIEDASRQTVFENCLADVNIPLGEVFTSPRLAGTEGVLNVSQVYLNGLSYVNLKVHFRDGMVTDYDCDNFPDSAEAAQDGTVVDRNKGYIRENVLFSHESLPIGEFAIGTNTTAYVIANRHKIVEKLPILIVEKMGPHFALGDTCYSWSEDIPVHNPNGKEIISRDNEITLKRKTNPEEAYFNCHTDITIPYDEIGEITAVAKDGTRTVIIRDGRFVLPGTEKLNEPFQMG
jgi:leucyl aminopeptidase (aminopeptidase T)